MATRLGTTVSQGWGDTPTVDVVVVAHNGGAGLQEAVYSILGSSNVAVRVIVVDNASTDGSAERISHELVEVIRLPKNRGYGAAFNVGLAHSRSRWTVCANQDVQLGTASLRRLLDTVRDETDRQSGPVVCGPRIVRDSGKLAETCHGLPTLRHELQELLLGEAFGTRNTVPASHIPDLPVVCGWVSAVFLIAETDVFRMLGGYDPDYFMYVEDLDLFRRLHDAGGRCVWEPRSVVVHRGGVVPERTRPTTGAMYGLTLWNLGHYFHKHARAWPRAQRTLVLLAGALGALARAGVWWLRAAGSTRRARGNSPSERGSGQRTQAMSMARMFAGASWLAARSIPRRHPAEPIRVLTGQAGP